MKELEEKLTPHNFFRCAKGYLVNMNHVEGFVGSDCVINNVHIPVSRAKKKEFMNLLLQNLNME
jgi:DNA-binding LytR/AlgR family response regulator